MASGRCPGLLFSLLLVLGPFGWAFASAQDIQGEVRSFSLAIDNIENRYAIFEESGAASGDGSLPFIVEMRVTDAELLMEMAEYEDAAALYRDLVEYPGFSGHPAYYPTLLRLGQCLLHSHNPQIAHRYFLQVAASAPSPLQQQALTHLLKIAVESGHLESLRELEERPRFVEYASPEVWYAYGRLLYHRGQMRQAFSVFSRLPVGAVDYGRARFFMGAIEAKEGRWEEAANFFLMAQKAADKESQELYGQAVLAQARALYALKRYSDAIVVLQEVPMQTEAYLESLFDTAWTFMMVEEPEKAIHALNILMMLMPQTDLAMRANALRGRIQSGMQDTEGARDTYRELFALVQPVLADLDRIAADPTALGQLLNAMTTDTITPPVDGMTQVFLDGDPQVSRLLQMVQKLAVERKKAEESLEVAGLLLQDLQYKNPLDIYLPLKDAWFSMREMEIELLLMGCRIVAALEAARPIVGARRMQELSLLQTRLQSAVQTLADQKILQERNTRMSSGVERDLFLLEHLLSIEQRQLHAIEEWAGVHVTQEVDQDVADRVTRELHQHHALLRGLTKEIQAVRNELFRKRMTPLQTQQGMEEDVALRRMLGRALKEAAQLGDEKSRDARREDGEDNENGQKEAWDTVQAAVWLLYRIDGLIAKMRPVADGVIQRAQDGERTLRGKVSAQRSHLEEVVSELQRAEMDARLLVQEDGGRAFQGMKVRLQTVLLGADIGLAEMAWKREQEIFGKLRQLGLNRAEKMQALEKSLQMVRQSREQLDAARAGEAL